MSGTHLVAGKRIPYEASPATSRWGYLSPATCRWGKARQFARERGDYTWEEWKEAKNFVTFCFLENEDIEVKVCGARVVCDEDLEQDIINVFDRLSQRGGVMYLYGLRGYMKWSW
ncbi:hypothetical protein Tco_1487177 [Tanacetum coccineum]